VPLPALFGYVDGDGLHSEPFSEGMHVLHNVKTEVPLSIGSRPDVADLVQRLVDMEPRRESEDLHGVPCPHCSGLAHEAVGTEAGEDAATWNVDAIRLGEATEKALVLR
jgi:hypothetical protein